MISKTSVARETARRLRTQSIRTGDEVRRLRLDAGVSLREMSAVTGIHPSHLARIETAEVRPTIEALTKIGVALGADVSIRYFVGTGPRLHDRFQAPMIEALLRMLDDRWVPTPEVPVVHPARGVIDLVLDDLASPTTIASESQSEITRSSSTFAGVPRRRTGWPRAWQQKGRATVRFRGFS